MKRARAVTWQLERRDAGGREPRGDDAVQMVVATVVEVKPIKQTSPYGDPLR